MKLYFTLVFALVTTWSIGQVRQGDWLVKGKGNVLNTTRQNSSFSNTHFDIAVGYAIRDRWVAGAGIALELSESRSYVSNTLFGRYYFRDTVRTSRMYLESRWEAGQFARIRAGQSGQRFNLSSGVLGLGIDYFLSKKLALEVQLDYYFFNKITSPTSVDRNIYDFFTMDFTLQYFFRYRDYRVERLIDYRNTLRKGTWFLGGRMVLHERGRTSLRNIQNFRPLLGYLLKKNWALGTEVIYEATVNYQTITLGLQPFSRYYINVGRKKKIYVQGNVAAEIIQQETNRGKYQKQYMLEMGGSIGWSNFINEEVSLDISYGISKSYQYDDNFGRNRDLLTTSGLSIALQYFFHRKSASVN